MQRKNNAGGNDKSNYFVRFAHGEVSLLELECLRESARLNFEIQHSDTTGCLISCSETDSKRIISLLGGSYKMVKVLGDNLVDSVRQLPLPYEAKFGWTISSYNCPSEIANEAREEVKDYLKEHDFGKSKYIQPTIESNAVEDDENEKGIQELKASELAKRIIASDVDGIDFVVHGGIEGIKPFFGYAISLSDVNGFEERDFERPYQDPRITLGTRIARIVCNLAAPEKNSVLADPFCGLGTILQEALVAGHRVIGIDKNSENVFKAKSNLNWLTAKYRIPKFNIVRMLRSSARRLDQLPIPRLDCIATEPILLPTYSANPSSEEASSAMSRSYSIYEESLQGMVGALSGKNSRICLITPTLFDSRGKSSTIQLKESAARIGLKEYWPRTARKRPKYPLRISTSKRKTVQRNVTLYIPV